MHWTEAALKRDLSGYDTEHLCTIFVVEFYRVVAAVIWALDDPQRPARDVVASALGLLRESPAHIQAEIARRDTDLAEQAVVYVAALRAVSAEVSRRAGFGPLAMWRSVTTGATVLGDLYKALRVERLTDYSDWDPRDLRQEALIGAGEQYRKEMRELAAVMPYDLELAPIETSLISTALRGARWEFWRAQQGRLVQGMFMQLVPLVTGRFKGIQDAARDSYRAEFEQRAAKKRGGGGGRHAKAAGTKQQRAQILSLNEQPEVEPDGAESIEDRTALRQEVSHYRRIMEKRHGARGRLLFEAVAQGATTEEAAQEIGIDQTTARRWLRKLPKT